MAFNHGDKMYFFSPISKKHEGGSRINRLTKFGYWRASQSISPILNKYGEKIGGKRPLVYYYKPKGQGIKTQWLMNEYTMMNQSHNLVLCEIHYKKIKEENDRNSSIASNLNISNPNQDTTTLLMNADFSGDPNILNPSQDTTLLMDDDDDDFSEFLKLMDDEDDFSEILRLMEDD